MTLFELTILGSNSALPAYGRLTTSQVVTYGNHIFLIDCGEGTQIRLSEYKIKRNKISHIFISHLHGDHIYGLPGVITSMNLNGRTAPLTIYGPTGIKKYIDVLMEVSQVHLNFDLEVIEITESRPLFENSGMTISCFEVYHRITTYGFKFQEKTRLRNIRKSAITDHQLTIEEIKSLKNGDHPERLSAIPLDELVLPIDDPRCYAYCADSLADHRLIPHIQGVNLLYFETTYLDDLREQAEARGHSTTIQSAQLALAAQVRQLVIGHYSSRYKDVTPLVQEAQTVFANTVMGYDGVMIRL